MASKKKEAKRKDGAKRAAETRAANKAAREEQFAKKMQLVSIILLAVGILSAAIVIIGSGKPFWQALRKLYFGMFGWCAYLTAPIIIYISAVLSIKKLGGAPAKKIWQMVGLMELLCAITEVFSKQTEYGSLGDMIAGLFNKGMEIKGGGLFSLPVAGTLLAFLGSAPARVIVIILLLVIIMLITKTTVADLVKTAAKPVKKIEQSYNEMMQNRREKRAIDIPVDDAPRSTKRQRQAEVTADSAKERLFEAAEENNSEKEIEEIKAPTEEEVQLEIDALIDKAKRTAEPKSRSAAAIDADADEEDGEEECGSAQYVYPPLELLAKPSGDSEKDVGEELKNNAESLVETLRSFGVQTRITSISRGPTVTRYELQPSAGVKISKITGLADDIALSLASAGVRIEAPIPNKSAVGIEVPNKLRSSVTIREIIDSDEFERESSKLTVSVGLDIAGNIITADLAKMPHALIAGTTGSGKSVCMNAFITSLLYKASPEEVRLIMIDPKMVEFKKYDGLPHLLVPVVTNPRKAAGALNWAVNEMLNRYKLFADNSVNDIKSYNAKAADTEGMEYMPQIVIIIDELSDLMMAAKKEVEDSICRLAQMARAAGMHLIIATQRPSVDVITGVIKANIPTRIALMLSSQVDSRTILDVGGAEKLLGNGDMLFHPVGSPKPIRVQGCFVSDDEVKKVVQFIKEGQTAHYDERVIDEIDSQAAAESSTAAAGEEEDCDPMLAAAIECVMDMGQASTSMLQRKLKLGYSRAGRLMDEMESRGIIGPFEGSKPRQILISRQEWIEMKMNQSE